MARRRRSEPAFSESDWLTGQDVKALLDYAKDKASERKLRLFACACYRRMYEWLADFQVDLRAVEIGERIADGLGAPQEFANVRIRAANQDLAEEVAFLASISADSTAGICAALRVAFGIPMGWHWKHTDKQAHEAICGLLLHCIIGNPFRPASPDLAWLTATVTSLAAAAYNDRGLPFDESDPERGVALGDLDPLRVAVLADALEEAGAPGELVEHLRSPDPHVRGCHVVDLCLGLS